MAKLSHDELIEQFKEMSLIELSEFVKVFEETFDVTAAARLPQQVQHRLAATLPRLKSRLSSTSFLKPLATRRSVSSKRCAA